MPPVDSTTGSACYLWSFSALGGQRAEILQVQPPPALAVGAHCMMRLTRILIFPFFLLASWISCPYIEVPSKMPKELLWKQLKNTLVQPASQLSKSQVRGYRVFMKSACGFGLTSDGIANLVLGVYLISV
jgi:hypothetical protein